MSVKSKPPAFRHEKRIIPILLRAALNSITGQPLRAVNANCLIGVLGRHPHNLAHMLTAIPGVNHFKTSLPTVSLPKKQTGNGNDYCHHAKADHPDGPPAAQQSNRRTKQKQSEYYYNADDTHTGVRLNAALQAARARGVECGTKMSSRDCLQAVVAHFIVEGDPPRSNPNRINYLRDKL